MAKRFIELEPQYRGKPFVINGTRYVRCRECAQLVVTKDCLVYGGLGLSVNVGLCRACGYKNERISNRKAN